MRRAIAETLFLLGKRAEGDKLFEQYLSSDPTWGWGWIGWSDELFNGDPNRNPDKAVEILKRGLSVDGLENKVHVLDRLKDIYNECEMHEEEERIQKEIDEIQKNQRAAFIRNKPSNMSTEIAKPDNLIKCQYLRKYALSQQCFCCCDGFIFSADTDS